ncbi:MAG TPA: hypothetical protein VK735_49730 [Pseudonocardia sp.]|uniref:hypothetical protein n=1 Tax=Pseudonocardia sp. TaxID=60912 RepID=UPI002CC878C5|nr:hypothetical protein [Pseudonocardia sp.]HTF55580.1 hypothetical protein [Pseudonocardia sp.]
MTVRLNQRALDHARNLIATGRYVLDGRDAWSEHQPSARQENAFIEEHGMAQYATWHLGIDDQEAADRKGHYKFPYGDFEKVHRCGVLAAESRAGQRKYYDIELAVAHLHGMLDALRQLAEPARRHRINSTEGRHDGG